MNQQRFVLKPLDLEGRAKTSYLVTLSVLILVGLFLFFMPQLAIFLFEDADLSIGQAVELLQNYRTFGGYCFFAAVVLVLCKSLVFAIMNDYRKHLCRSHEGRRHHC